MDAIYDRRQRARILRKKKEEEKFLEQFVSKSQTDVKEYSVVSKNKPAIKGYRMQNCKGTPGAFIKP
jgi:hypothetical protein